MTTTRLPDPPAQYERAYIEKMLNQINQQFRELEQRGRLSASTLNLSHLPTSATGLRSGDVWRDAGSANVLKIVP